MRKICKLNLKSPQIEALEYLGFEYIILGKHEKRLYAFFDTDCVKLSNYAKYKGIALDVDLFPKYIIDRIEADVFYKINN